MADLESIILSVTGDCSNTGAGGITILGAGGTPPYNFNWTQPNLGIDLQQTTSTRVGLYAGTYTVSITDSSSPNNTQIFANYNISNGVCCYISAVTNTTNSLFNGQVTGGSSSFGSTTNFFLFDSNNQQIDSATTSNTFFVFQNLSAGSYYVTAQDIGGCTGNSETFIVESSTTLNFGLYTVPNSSCGVGPLGKIYVTGQTGIPPYTYLWNNGETTSYITGLTAGDYSVTVTDAENSVLQKTTTITNVSPVSVVLISSNPPSCLQNNGSVSLLITGGTAPFYYSASTGSFGITYERNYTFSNLGSGPYGFSITDAAFCNYVISTTLATPSGMTFVNVQSTNSSCSDSDGKLQIYLGGGNPPYTYSLVYPTSNTNTITTNSTFYQFSNLSGGTYTLFVSDASGCTFTDDYSLITENKFTIDVTSTATTFGQKNGFITVTKSSGGTAPFNYVLDDDSSILQTTLSSVTFSNVASGQHTIRVSDSVNCIQTKQIYTESVPTTDFFLYPTKTFTTSGGTITALISSGVPPFTYQWSENVMSNPQSITVTGLTAGTYSLTLTDSNGSSLKRTTTVEGTNNIVSYELFTVGDKTFESVPNSKYSLSKMLNEGYQDLTSGQTSCSLSSATFIAKVVVEPFGTELTNTFFTTTSLLVSPDDNSWFNAIKDELIKVIGVSDVVIDPIENTLTIVSDRSKKSLIDGTNSIINLKIYLLIDYEIICK